MGAASTSTGTGSRMETVEGWRQVSTGGGTGPGSCSGTGPVPGKGKRKTRTRKRKNPPRKSESVTNCQKEAGDRGGGFDGVTDTIRCQRRRRKGKRQSRWVGTEVILFTIARGVHPEQGNVSMSTDSAIRPRGHYDVSAYLCAPGRLECSVTYVTLP
mgnify:CR=1 FL=1